MKITEMSIAEISAAFKDETPVDAVCPQCGLVRPHTIQTFSLSSSRHAGLVEDALSYCLRHDVSGGLECHEHQHRVSVDSVVPTKGTPRAV